MADDTRTESGPCPDPSTVGIEQGGARPASGIPASGIEAGGSRPPFPAGNALAVRHGARSPRVYGALAEELAAGLLEVRPDLAGYPEAVAAWATAEAQAALLRRHLAEVGLFTEDGEVRGKVLGYLRSFERLAAESRKPLGLDPMAEAALARERASAATLAVNLTAIADTGRQAIADREVAGLPAPPDLAGDVLRRTTAEARAEWDAACAAAQPQRYPDPAVTGNGSSSTTTDPTTTTTEATA